MKKIFLMGRSEAGKTSLTQALKGEELHYVKTQYTNTEDDTIAMVQAADEPFNLFGPGSRCFIQRPLIGVITKVDSPYANVDMVRLWMKNAGCERIFEVNNKTREGIKELMDYLNEPVEILTLDRARYKQSLGLNDWDPLPEGVEYPEGM